MAHEFIKTTRGGETLVVDNFPFRLSKKMPTGRRYWKCIDVTCPATAVTDGQNIVRACTAVAHNHASNEDDIKRQKFMTDFKNEVQTLCA